MIRKLIARIALRILRWAAPEQVPAALPAARVVTVLPSLPSPPPLSSPHDPFLAALDRHSDAMASKLTASVRAAAMVADLNAQGDEAWWDKAERKREARIQQARDRRARIKQALRSAVDERRAVAIQAFETES